MLVYTAMLSALVYTPIHYMCNHVCSIIWAMPGVSLSASAAMALGLLMLVSLILFAINTATEVGITYFAHEEGRESLSVRTDKTSRYITALTARLNEVLYLTSLGRTLLAIVYAVSACALTDYLWPGSLYHIIASLVAACFLLFFAGHILPRKFTLSSPLKFCSIICRPFWLALRCVLPLINAIVPQSHRGNFTRTPLQDIITIDDVEKVLDKTSETQSSEKSILRELIKFTEEEVGEVMTARVNIVALDIDSDYATVLQCIRDNNYSRIPVYEDSLDNVRGVLYIKDLLPHIAEGANFAWKKLMRPAYFVPETKMTDELLREFQSKKTHMAIVVDEFGIIVGLVTMEDLLEEIVGEINDEYDDDKKPYALMPDGSYIFETKILITDFLRILNEDEDYFLPVSEDVESLGGILTELFGEIPRPHETISYGKYSFEILNSDERHIIKARVWIEKSE